MTDIAAILASYRSGQISEADMVEICAEWPEVKEELERTSIANPVAVEAGGCAPPIIVSGEGDQNG